MNNTTHKHDYYDDEPLLLPLLLLLQLLTQPRLSFRPHYFPFSPPPVDPVPAIVVRWEECESLHRGAMVQPPRSRHSSRTRSRPQWRLPGVRLRLPRDDRLRRGVRRCDDTGRLPTRTETSLRNHGRIHLVQTLCIFIRFNKIAIQATTQISADKEAVALSRVHMCESSCIMSL